MRVPFGPESPATMREVLVSHLMPPIRGCDPRDTALDRGAGFFMEAGDPREPDGPRR